MCASDARGNKSRTEKLKRLWGAMQTRPDAKGIASLFPKNGGERDCRAVKFFLRGRREKRNPVVYISKRNYFGVSLINKGFCARQGISTNHLGESKKYSLPFYTRRD